VVEQIGHDAVRALRQVHGVPTEALVGSRAHRRVRRAAYPESMSKLYAPLAPAPQHTLVIAAPSNLALLRDGSRDAAGWSLLPLRSPWSFLKFFQQFSTMNEENEGDNEKEEEKKRGRRKGKRKLNPF
jgi:hypothetical protein